MKASMNPINTSMSVRSDYSLGESSFQVGKIIDMAKALEITHVGIVDYMTISGLPKINAKAKKAGVTVVTGCTLQVVDDPTAKLKDRENNGYRLKVYVKSEKGLQSLFRALSKSMTPEHYYYHARLGLDDVLALEDVVVTSGDVHSMWSHPNAESIHEALRVEFGPDYMPELIAVDTPLYDRINAIILAHNKVESCCVSRPAFYATAEDADATDVLRAISTNTEVSSIFLPRPYSRDLCMRSGAVMVEQVKAMLARQGLTAGTGVLIHNTGTIAAKCTYTFSKMAPTMPKMAPDEFLALCKAVNDGWNDRMGKIVWGHRPKADELPAYKERLVFELGVLKKMGFSGYFLLVQDIVNWSKANNIRVGPGRGSVGGSLVAYLMGITDIDPIRFGLLFERFINPDRIDLPDADLDFMSGRRHEVIDYIVNKWGKENVAGIVNFSTLGPASALRDTARMHTLSPVDYACSKLMEKEHGVSLSLVESADKVPDIDRFRRERPVLWDYALRLEGANRGLSQHAAGVIVAGSPINERAVVSTRGELPMVQWDKTQVEDFGLIKIDILGLNTLDLIESSLDYIRERHKKNINVLALPLDDARVLAAFGKGDTTGVFQFTGGGMKKLLKDMAQGGPLTFDDLCAASALFRPGPLDAGLCDRYVAVKQGAARPYYEHPLLEECLGDTFGVIVYQEQVMKICRVLCGFSPGDADGVRKAIGKKDADKMAEYGDRFRAGAVSSGMSEDAAGKLWDTILGFAGYAFNKSHSAEYALISWVTMWLKVYYPAEFFAAAMTVIEKEEQLAGLVMDAQARKLMVLPPDLNKSSARIEIEGEDKLYAPFQAVKGISTNVAAAIMKLREKVGGEFTLNAAGDIDGFDPAIQKEVLGRTQVNSAHRAKLELVGAFHSTTGKGTIPMHPDRLRDRIALMPGFTVDMVKADRALSVDHLTKLKLTSLIEQFRSCEGCSLKGAPHPYPRIGEKPKFMMVFDSPNWKEEKAGKMMEGEGAEYIRAALKDAGLKSSDGYYTSLVKSMKPKDAKTLSNEQISGCGKWLNMEIEALKPAVIVTMGGNAARFFAPGVKGSPTDLAGTVVFNKELDASIIFGINPGSLYHDPSKIKYIELVAERLATLLS